MLSSPSRRSSDTRRRVPRPPQVGQAPNGELNEKWRGSSSGSEMPQTAHPYFSENISTDLPSAVATSATPSANRSAVSSESLSRLRSSGFTLSRSTTTEMLWFWRRFIFGGSATSISSPSTQARTNPCLRTLSNSSRNSPLRSCTRGARTSILVSGSQVRMTSAICAGLWRWTGRPQFGQCGVPARAYSKPQVVVDLGDRSDGGPRVVSGALLLDGDRRRQPLDRIDVRLFHQPEELAGVGRQRLDVPALAFGVNRVERERRFAGSREPRDHRQAVAGDADVDVSEVVLACSANNQRIFCHSQGKLRPSAAADKRARYG